MSSVLRLAVWSRKSMKQMKISQGYRYICLIISIYSRFPIHFRWLNFCTKLAKPVKRLANRQTCELAWLGIRILLKSITKAPIPVGGESFWNAVLKYKDSTFREMFLAIQNILVFFIAEILVWTGISSHTRAQYSRGIFPLKERNH